MQKQAMIAAMMLGMFFALAAGRAAAQSAGPAPSVNDTLVEKQQAAISAARSVLAQPLPDAAAASAGRPAGIERAGPNRASKVLLAASLLILGMAVVVFYLSRQPAPPLASAVPTAVRAPDEASNIRAILEKTGGQAGAGAPAREQSNAGNPRFLDLAVENQVITAAERAALSGRFQGNDYALMLFLVEQRPSLKDPLGKLWGDSLGLAYTDPTKAILQSELLAKLPKNFAAAHGVIPLYESDNVITVAMTDPNNTALQRQMENHLDALISPVFALPDQINAALEIAQISLRALKDQLSQKLASAAQEGARIGRVAETESIAEFVRSLFLLALKQHASDIHLEPQDSGVCVRLRIDGVLQEYLRLPMRLFPSLSNVIKIMAAVDIGERRRPQDGRITLKLPDRELEFRFSCVPTIYGEKIVLRLLGQNQFASVPTLDDLYFSKPILDGMRRIIHSPNGVFFVTGPTGSGKTTTLYAALNALNGKDCNIMTIEDPVEYRLQGINQVQVNPPAGVTFATALRAFLRQDPDVILVGEIRDLETANIAAQAALTGHLVLTTMHTNNALQAVTRLIQIGVEPFLVAPSIIGVMAQRLTRRLCEHCKEKYALTPGEIEQIFDGDGSTAVFFHRPKGCEACNFTGYAGRIAIHELFIIDEGMRQHIARNASIIQIQEYAHSAGFTTMRYDGLKKVLLGLTSIEEVNQTAQTLD